VRWSVELVLKTEDPVWYVAYGSNLCAARFACYVSGGRPRGGARTYRGCRDQTPPRRDVGIRLAGGLVFAGASRVWGGGIAFYDPDAGGELMARAYQLDFGQLSDVVAQETWRPIGENLLLDDEFVSAGGARRAVPNRWPVPARSYDTLLHVGDRDGLPMFTITCLQGLEPAPPTAPYLRMMLDGLFEAFGGTADERADYLLRTPGVSPTWTASRLIGLCDNGAGVTEQVPRESR
jgi:hypothetical protein